MNKIEQQKQLGYAITLVGEVADIIDRVEPLVIGNLKHEIHGDEALGWAVAGSALTFAAIRKTLELMQVTATANYQTTSDKTDA